MKFKRDVYYLCRTEDLAKEFLEECEKDGIKWTSGLDATDFPFLKHIRLIDKDVCFIIQDIKETTIGKLFSLYGEKGYDCLSFAYYCDLSPNDTVEFYNGNKGKAKDKTPEFSVDDIVVYLDKSKNKSMFCRIIRINADKNTFDLVKVDGSISKQNVSRDNILSESAALDILDFYSKL